MRVPPLASVRARQAPGWGRNDETGGGVGGLTAGCLTCGTGGPPMRSEGVELGELPAPTSPMISGKPPGELRAPRRLLAAAGLLRVAIGVGEAGLATGRSSKSSSSKSSASLSTPMVLGLGRKVSDAEPPIRSDGDDVAGAEAAMSPPMMKSCRAGLDEIGSDAGSGALESGALGSEAVGSGVVSSPPMIMSARGLLDLRWPPYSGASRSSTRGSAISASSGRGRDFLGAVGFLGARAMAKR